MTGNEGSEAKSTQSGLGHGITKDTAKEQVTRLEVYIAKY